MPAYIDLFDRGILEERGAELEDRLSACDLCPRCCGVDRRAGQKGFCSVDACPKIASINIHPWEEPPLSGARGSGTIFFSGCTMGCVFCQNYPISQLGVGRVLTVEELADGMLRLQRRGAHNINLVTATHQMAAVVRALCIAVPRGLHIPLVYNSSGYERLETLRLLEGVIDIYLPDIKYSNPQASLFCSGRSDYVQANRRALLEMWRQVGPLETDGAGLAVRGMLVRHLVLPEDLSSTRDCLAFLAEHMGSNVWISLMHQYFPAYKAHHLPPLHRRVMEEEYEQAFAVLDEFRLENGFVQMFAEDDDHAPLLRSDP